MKYTQNDIEKYWKGQLSPEEMNALEKAALDDPFLADAMDGYQHAVSPAMELGELRKQLADRVSGTPSLPQIHPAKTYWWKVAASIVVVGGLGYLAYQFIPGQKNEAVAVEEKVTVNPSPAQIPDTAVDAIVESKQKTVTNKKETEDLGNIVTPLNSDTAKDKSLSEYKEQKREDAEIASAAGETRSAPVKTDTLVSTLSKPRSQDIGKQGNTSLPPASKKDEGFIGYENTSKGKVSDSKGKKSRTITYRARVVDNNNNAIAYANVFNLGNEETSLADKDGYFIIPATEDSLVLLNVSSQGFTSREFRLNRFNRKAEDLVLYETPDNSEPAEVTVSAELEDPVLLENDKKGSTPVPQTGWSLFNQQIANNLTRDRESLSRGEVILAFTISKSGKPTNIRVVRSLQPPNDQEAVRLLRQGPDWSGNSRSGEVRIIFRFK